MSLLPALAVSDVTSLTILPNKSLLAFLGCLWRKTHANSIYQHIKITGIIYCNFASIDKAKLEFSFYGQRLNVLFINARTLGGSKQLASLCLSCFHQTEELNYDLPGLFTKVKPKFPSYSTWIWTGDTVFLIHGSKQNGSFLYSAVEQLTACSLHPSQEYISCLNWCQEKSVQRGKHSSSINWW